MFILVFYSNLPEPHEDFEMYYKGDDRACFTVEEAMTFPTKDQAITFLKSLQDKGECFGFEVKELDQWLGTMIYYIEF